MLSLDLMALNVESFHVAAEPAPEDDPWLFATDPAKTCTGSAGSCGSSCELYANP